jgi:hypothetical protein
MPPRELEHARWRKARRSQTQSQCVEIADLGDRAAVRDSKDPDGGALILTNHQMGTLLSCIKTGQLDR